MSDAGGWQEAEYDCHNEIKKISKKIAKLVAVQKALKAEMAERIELTRWFKDMREDYSE